MADVQIIPRIRCDNCGFVADKDKARGGEFMRPLKWGGVNVSPTEPGNYPNPISMKDLCPKCLQAVHKSVVAALRAAREEPAHG